MPVPVAGGSAELFLAIFGALILFGLLGFDTIRTRRGVAYFCFVCKIWFELVVMTFLMFMHVLTFAIILSLNNSRFLKADPSAPDTNSFTVLQLTWAFQLLVAAITFLYVTYLGCVAAWYSTATPKVFGAAVRDIPWGSRAVRRNVRDEAEPPIHFPTMTLSTYDELFAALLKRS